MAKQKNETPDVRLFILNCEKSEKTETDWTGENARESGLVTVEDTAPASVDLRANWWPADDQKTTGACVGFAAACGVLRWHYYKKGLIRQKEKPSARFIWMADKETDDITNYPTTFLESAGTQTKHALRVARNFGCVLDTDLPMNGNLSSLSPAAFYTRAARLRINSYHNLGNNFAWWRLWLAYVGPILTRIGVDRTWDNATNTNGKLETYLPNTVRGGHAICIVGYTKDYFIVRNSWGTNWGVDGFAYAYNNYAAAAFSHGESYGVIV